MGGIDLHDSPQLGTAALMVSSLRRSVVPVIAILALGGLIGCLTYVALAPAPISQSATLATHSAKEAPSTVGQGLTENALTVIDGQRQLTEEIARSRYQGSGHRSARLPTYQHPRSAGARMICAKCADRRSPSEKCNRQARAAFWFIAPTISARRGKNQRGSMAGPYSAV